eukprot:TRINITY_DN366_c0_g1_i2.p1 TRINITY_DN366_c0_g1~~TRINITY_DN366_c0_g1_i2.p1  ORF type:complete len:2833 (+),score=824.11 TRINITY_DN366_c0_g1_i2:1027-9525(+)
MTYVDLANNGRQAGKFHFIYDEALPLRIVPKKGTVEAESHERVKVEFLGTDIGVFRAFAQVELEGQQTRVLDINSSVVEQSLELIDPKKKPVQMHEFGTIYFGQEKVFTATLVNNGPQTITYAAFAKEHIIRDEATILISSPVNDRPSSSATDATSGGGADKKSQHDHFTVEPAEGALAPYGTADIHIKFRPRQSRTGGFKSNVRTEDTFRDYTYLLNIDVLENGLSLDIPLGGKAVMCRAEASHRLFRFGDCPVHEYIDAPLEIKNLCDELPLPFALSPVAHFTATPLKGVLGPLETKELYVRFKPNELGVAQNQLQLKLGNGLEVIPIKVHGNGTKPRGNKKLVGGPDKTAEDFDKPVHLGEPGVGTVVEKTQFRRTKLWETQAAVEAEMDERTVKRALNTRNIEEMKQFAENRDKYTNVLKEQRKQRAATRAAKNPQKNYNDEVNIGLNPGSGMRSPRLELPREVDPLYLEIDPSAADGGLRPKARKRTTYDENKLIKKKFKPHPTSKQELAECKSLLTLAQLQNIYGSPQMLDFGTVCVHSTTYKSLTITNDLRQSIVGRIFCAHEELASSTPESQVIPHSTTAGFDIAFCSDTVQSFRKTINYIINEQHTFKVIVCAEVVPINLSLNRDTIIFRFAEDATEPVVTETISVHNPGNHKAEYKWDFDSNSVFSVTPTAGYIESGRRAEFKVTFRPAVKTKSEEYLVLKVNGGPDRRVRCVGEIGEAKCAFSPKSLDFGFIPVGTYETRTVVLRNTGVNDAFFHFDTPLEGVSISPQRGRLTVSNRQEITITLTPMLAMEFNTQLICHIRGGRTLKLPLVATASLPDLSFGEGSAFSFNDCYVGEASDVTWSIVNKSNVVASLFLDLRDYPAFRAYVNEADAREGADLDETLCEPVTAQRMRELSNQVEVGATDSDAGALSPRGGPVAGSAAGAQSLARAQSQSTVAIDDGSTLVPGIGDIFHLTVPPEETLPIRLTYTPSEVTQLSFTLPLSVPGLGAIPELSPTVTAKSLRPKLVTSTTLVDFGQQLVMKKPSGTAQETKKEAALYFQDVTLSNNDMDALSWDLDCSHDLIKEGIFTVEPTGGFLESGESGTVRICFYPRESITYEADFAIHVDNRRDGAFMHISLTGEGTVPQLKFSKPELILPIVPLGVEAIGRFEVINSGYNRLNLTYKLPVDQSKVPLEISFPEGEELGVSVERLPVLVKFAAKTSMSFIARVDFFDHEGNKFTIPISGTTDNSLLSCHDFLHQHAESYTVAATKGSRALNLVKKPDVELDALLNRPPQPSDLRDMTGDFLGREENDKALQSQLVTCMVRWLNTNVMKKPIEEFPTDLADSNGKMLFDMVEVLSGKNIFKKQQGQPSSLGARTQKVSLGRGARREAALKLQGQYEEMLTFLKSQGALLSTVKPQHLLRLEDYYRVTTPPDSGTHTAMSATSRASRLSARSREQSSLGRTFPDLSASAWLTLLTQCIKVFVLSRVSVKQFKALPGLKPAANQKLPKICQAALDTGSVGQSNIYGVPEGLILNWLTFHYNNQFPDSNKRITNFTDDLKDSRALSAAILAYSPSVTFSDLHFPCVTNDQLKQNAEKVIGAMKKLNLAYIPEVSEIIEPKAPAMMLLCMALYQSVPQYTPKTTIEFVGALNEPVSKNIELSNPSAKPIQYSARLEGSPDFALERDQIVVEPKSKAQVPVTLTARFMTSVEARLVLTSRRAGITGAAGASAVPLVFILKSNIQSVKPKKEIECETAVYEPTQLNIEVQNPFEYDCVLHISLDQKKLPPHKKPSKNRMPIRRDDKKPKAPEPFTPDPFYVGETAITIKRGKHVILPVSFTPFQPGHYRGDLRFHDEEVGEFVYRMTGYAKMPEPIETFKIKAESGQENVTQVIKLGGKNHNYERCRALLSSHLSALERKKLPSHERERTYKVELTSPYFTAPSSLQVYSIPDMNEGKDKDSKETSRTTERTERTPKTTGRAGDPEDQFPDEANTLEIGFAPRAPGTYTCELILRSLVDLRVYSLEVFAMAPPSNASLEFSCNAREQVTQDIPVVNKTDTDWLIHASLISEGGLFRGPTEFRAGRHETAKYPLRFCPKWIGTTSGELTLTNAQTGDKSVFQLTGVCKEPLAEDHLVIECRARQRMEYTVKVPCMDNSGGKYRVESDLAYVHGDPTVMVRAGGQTSNYKMEIFPQQGGAITGSVTFIAPNGHYAWYTVEIHVDAPPPERKIAVQAELRKAVAIEIGVTNPLNEAVEFDVTYSGPGIIADPFLSLGPHETATCEVIYSPLRPGQFEGSITFFNATVGEFWYELQLTAVATAPTIVPAFYTQVGQSMAKEVELENPLNENITLKVSNDNPTNFKVVPAHPSIPAYTLGTFKILYTPSSISEAQTATIKLSHKTAGEWEYHVTGQGTPPSQMPETSISAALGQSTSTVLSFKNPFPRSMIVNVELADAAAAGKAGFEVLAKKRSNIQLQPFGTLAIPIGFKPVVMREVTSVLMVRGPESMTWSYPVVGIAEAPLTEEVYRFKCRARERTEQQLEVYLRGLVDETVDMGPDGQGEAFTYELKMSAEMSNAAHQPFSILPVSTHIVNAETPLRFNVKFEPLKAMTEQIELVVDKASGGRWRYAIALRATPPELDDVIVIESQLNQASSVSFELFNPFPAFSPFTTRLEGANQSSTNDVVQEMSVFPSTGVLAPFGTEQPTEFVITYSPIRYGKTLTANLIVTSAEMQWIYQIHGSHPQYQRPQGKATFSTTLTKEQKQKWQEVKSKNAGKNFMRENQRNTNVHVTQLGATSTAGKGKGKGKDKGKGKGKGKRPWTAKGHRRGRRQVTFTSPQFCKYT